MKENTKKNFVISGILLIVAIVYILLVKVVDVSAIGPNGSSVGFSTLNKAVSDTIGVNMLWYDITKYVGYLAFTIIAFYGCTGLFQLIQNKSLKKVEPKLYVLAVFYVAVMAIYVLFEIMVVNYRPTLIDGELEASFPSSHTMLALCVCGSSLLISKYIIKNESFRKIFDIVTWGILLVVLVGRIISGVHWCSDIIGGIIISAFLLMTFYATIKALDEKKV